MSHFESLATMRYSVLLTFIFSCVLQFVLIAVAVGNPLHYTDQKPIHVRPNPVTPRRLDPINSPSERLRWIMQRVGKRGSEVNKCEENMACAMLQVQPGTSSYWIEEICSCGQDAPCSTEWSDHNADGRSIDNADTQLKLCKPVKEFPTCASGEVSVTSSMETSIAAPAITQTAEIFCSCPKTNHEYKLLDAGMKDYGDRTVVSAHFGCIPVEHCLAYQPCKFLAILPTGDALTHQNCSCAEKTRCPRESNITSVTPAIFDEISYYPFFCQ